MNRASVSEAPVGLLPLPRPLMTGEVLDASFRLFRATLLRALPYSFLAVIALQFPALYGLFFGSGKVLLQFAPISGMAPDVFGDREVILIAAVLFCTLLFGVITLRLHAVSRGVPPRFRAEIATAFRRWPTSVIATVGSLGLPIVLIFIWPFLTNLLPWPALIVLALPLLWPAALFAVALPAFWADGLGPFAAIARAFRISRRRTWRMIGALFATGCVIAVFYGLAAVLLGLLGQLVGRADLILLTTISSMIWVVMGAFGVPFVLATLVVAHEDLKLRDAELRGARA